MFIKFQGKQWPTTESILDNEGNEIAFLNPMLTCRFRLPLSTNTHRTDSCEISLFMTHFTFAYSIITSTINVLNPTTALSCYIEVIKAIYISDFCIDTGAWNIKIIITHQKIYSFYLFLFIFIYWTTWNLFVII